MVSEGQLREACKDFHETFSEEHCQLKLINEQAEDTVTNIKVIDFCHIFGASINRTENRLRNVSPLVWGPFKNGTIPGFKLYMATNMNSVPVMNMNLELSLRIETSLKM